MCPTPSADHHCLANTLSFCSPRALVQSFGLLQAQGPFQAGSACLGPLLLETFLSIIQNYTCFKPHPAETASESPPRPGSCSEQVPNCHHRAPPFHYVGHREWEEGHSLTRGVLVSGLFLEAPPPAPTTSYVRIHVVIINIVLRR